VPIVRATGGLADTIADVDEHKVDGTGFVFDEYDSAALLSAVTRAISLFRRKKSWRQVMKAGMRRDFSWKSSALRYEQLYQKAMSKP
jgi:starch synthase